MMRRRRTLALGKAAFCAVVLPLAGAALAAPESHAERTILHGTPVQRISGRVVDLLGRPVPLFTISVESGSSVVARASTDAEGRFEIDDLPPGRLKLVASSTHENRGGRLVLLGTGEVEIELAEEQHLVDVVIVARVGGVLSGRVVDADGQPVQHAAVFAEALASGLREGGRTDAEGRYTLTFAVPAGRQRVTVRHRRHGDLDRWVDVRVGPNTLDFQLPRPLEICGRVVEGDGLPVAGAQLVLLAPDQSLVASGGGESRPDGTYLVDVPRSGTFWMRVMKPGYVTAYTDLFFVGPEPARCDGEIVLPRGATLAGRVRWAEGAEPVDLWAQITGQMPVKVDDDRFELTGVPPGRHVVRVYANRGIELEEWVEVEVAEDAAEVPVEVVVGDGFVLAVRVLRGGEPAYGQSLRLSAGERRWLGLTDEDGWARFGGLDAGEYRLGIPRLEERTISLPAAEPVVFQLEESHLDVVVVEQAGETVRSQTLSVELVTFDERMSYDAEAVPGEPGLRRAHAPPGRYRLRVTAQEYLPFEREVEVVAESSDVLRVQLAHGPETVVRVRGHAGAIPYRVHLTARDPEGRVYLGGGRGFPTGPEGEIRLRGLPAGELEIEASAPGFAAARRRLVVPGPPLDLELGPEARIEVEVRALADSAQPATLQVRRAPGGEVYWLSLFGPTNPIWRGRCTLQELPAGSWRIEVESADGRRWMGEVVNRAGLTTSLRLEGEGDSDG